MKVISKKGKSDLIVHILANETGFPIPSIFHSQLCPVPNTSEPDIYSGLVGYGLNPLKLLNIPEVPPLMPGKNYFLNLSRTGGESVNCFRLPSQRRLAHHSRSINPFH